MLRKIFADKVNFDTQAQEGVLQVVKWSFRKVSSKTVNDNDQGLAQQPVGAKHERTGFHGMDTP